LNPAGHATIAPQGCKCIPEIAFDRIMIQFKINREVKTSTADAVYPTSLKGADGDKR
jgi:hypothetical protein